MGQLSLFGGVANEDGVEPALRSEDRDLAAALPRFVRFGTSSWSFPGWSGIVWKGRPSESELARAGLAAYAQQPLLRAVSLDRGYYGPVRADELATYGAQLAVARERGAAGLAPFRIVSKVWDEITTAVFPSHPRYGARAGQKNPFFLDARRFVEDVLAPYRDAFPGEDDVGPFVFELTPMPRGAIGERELTQRVDAFLAQLPSSRTGRHRWAFELRNQELFGRRWLDMLRANGAAHVFTYWTAMPSLRVQLRAGALVAPFTVVRLMLPPFTRYATQKATFAPFDKLAAPQEEMRDDVVDILRAAAEADCDDAFVLVNNKAEGSAPLTVRALAERTAAAFR